MDSYAALPMWTLSLVSGKLLNAQMEASRDLTSVSKENSKATWHSAESKSMERVTITPINQLMMVIRGDQTPLMDRRQPMNKPQELNQIMILIPIVTQRSRSLKMLSMSCKTKLSQILTKTVM